MAAPATTAGDGARRPEQDMARQDQANDQFSLTSFLYGGNAGYIEELYAQWQEEPASVGDEWRDFFSALKDDAEDVTRNARGASWKKPGWPQAANGELVSALDGNWAAVEKHIATKVKEKAKSNGLAVSGEDVLRATRDSVRAIMMIRAFRMRGHLHANLDPLGFEKRVQPLPGRTAAKKDGLCLAAQHVDDAGDIDAAAAGIGTVARGADLADRPHGLDLAEEVHRGIEREGQHRSHVSSRSASHVGLRIKSDRL